MNKKVTIFAMTEKGYRVLEALLSNFSNNIATVVSSTDPKIEKDFYLEIKSLCQKKNINFLNKKDVSIIETKYAMAISWRWLINTENTKLIVFHDSLLPRYRGFNPLVSALINGDNKIGVTALFATEEYDRGQIIAQAHANIDYPIKIQEAIEKVSTNYQQIAIQIMTLITNGQDLKGKPQNEESASYSLWRDEEDYFIDWQQSSYLIKRFIDAVGYPYQGAATRLDGEIVRILDADTIEDVYIENRTPGKVIFIQNYLPVIVCGKGLLKIKKMVNEEQKSLLPLPRFRLRFK